MKTFSLYSHISNSISLTCVSFNMILVICKTSKVENCLFLFHVENSYCGHVPDLIDKKYIYVLFADNITNLRPHKVLYTNG